MNRTLAIVCLACLLVSLSSHHAQATKPDPRRFYSRHIRFMRKYVHPSGSRRGRAGIAVTRLRTRQRWGGGITVGDSDYPQDIEDQDDRQFDNPYMDDDENW